MHCVVMSSPKGKRAWQVYRSAEIIGYHQKEQRVRILLALLARNLLEDDSNCLHVLHRGNVDCKPARSWPLPRHTDEKRAGWRLGVIEELYGRAFVQEDDCVYRERALSPWDSWDGVERERVLPWPPEVDQGDARWLRRLEPCAVGGEYVPFTRWELGPFSAKALYLIALSLEYSGITYERLVESGSAFTVDGPKRLLGRIRCEDFADLEKGEEEVWLDALASSASSDKVLSSDGYDIVILGPPAADEVVVRRDRCANGIVEAPLQPGRRARRFVTDNQLFTITIGYAATDQPAAASAV